MSPKNLVGAKHSSRGPAEAQGHSPECFAPTLKALTICVVLLLAWGVETGGRAADEQISPEVVMEAPVVQGNTEFALSLYAQLGTQPGNLFFSPLSLSTALAMTYAGARGQTATQMATVLHFPADQQRLHSTFAAL